MLFIFLSFKPKEQIRIQESIFIVQTQADFMK